MLYNQKITHPPSPDIELFDFFLIVLNKLKVGINEPSPFKKTIFFLKILKVFNNSFLPSFFLKITSFFSLNIFLVSSKVSSLKTNTKRFNLFFKLCNEI